MTGLEIYLEENNWKLVGGKRTEFSTYDNCSRVWTLNEKNIVIGLASAKGEGETQIFVIFPSFSFLPKDNFAAEIDKIFKRAEDNKKLIKEMSNYHK